ncbi:MAG: hypothetical protein JW940_06550 [Polyangiaceae bacterium]|nr:hypothetical protein [Polyangiaceae bacterium]
MAISLNRLLWKRRGVGMTEYLVLVGVIAIVAIIAFKFFVPSVRDRINQRDNAEANVVTEE